MKKLIFALLVVALLATMSSNAEATTHHYHIVKSPRLVKLTSVNKYRYVYHRLSTIKCPFAGCRRNFTHN